jgi:hypothetical protein
MNGDDLRDDIALLEQRIEHLREARERCRKISLAAKTTIAAGAVVSVLTLLTVIAFYPSAFFGALAAMIGGAVLLGSNKTTWEQTEEELRKAEALRDQFIGSIDMKVVGDERPTLH